MEKAILSKSTFIKGVQCDKALYLYKNFYHLRDEIPPQLQAIFAQGTNVGLLAQDLFPGGVDASPSSYKKMQESVFKTREYIERGEKIIYEATFQYSGVIAALDILVMEEDGWKAYEVKSSTKVSETNELDAAIQYYTIVNSGIDLKDISIVYINNQYVKKGTIEINKLFNIHSVNDEVQSLLPKIPNQIAYFKKLIKQDAIPTVDIGAHCDYPYGCDFKGQCWTHIPEYSIFNISGLKANRKFELYSKGITTFDQIDLDTAPLNKNQKLQVICELEKSSFIATPQVQRFLNELNYPIYHLDFETMATAVPIFDDSRPYQQLVFQYSLHIEEENGNIEHKEYLAEASTSIDPRKKFVEQLIKDCGNEGDVLVYNISFEKGKLNDLIHVFPEYRNELKAIVDRLKDLMIPFNKKWVYKPDMRGSYSIKSVLPALVPSLSYNELEIKEGATASNTFTKMVLGSYDGDIEETRTNLLEYCKMDTYAMVKILSKLRELISE